MAEQTFPEQTFYVWNSMAPRIGAISSGTINAEPLDSERQDNITVLDVRTERSVVLPHHLRVRGFVDRFNLTNTNAADARTPS